MQKVISPQSEGRRLKCEHEVFAIRVALASEALVISNFESNIYIYTVDSA